MENIDSQHIRMEKILTAAIVIIMTIAIGFALFWLKTILMPFFVAVILAYIFSPIIENLAKIKIPRAFSIIVLFILTFVLITWLGGYLFDNINELVVNWPQMQIGLEHNLEIYASKMNLNSHNVLVFLKNSIKSISFAEYGLTIITSSVFFLGNVLITLLFMVFLLFSAHTFPEKIHAAFSEKKAQRINKVIKKINAQIQKYLLIKTIISLSTGATVYLILLAFDIKFAFLWGALTFSLNYIPNIGDFLAGVPPVLTAFLQYGLTKALIVLVILICIQFIYGNIIETLVIGKKLNLSPIVVLLSLLFWGWLWGIVGAIISVPLMAVIKIVFINIKGLEPIAILMSEK